MFDQLFEEADDCFLNADTYSGFVQSAQKALIALKSAENLVDQKKAALLLDHCSDSIRLELGLW